MFKAEFAMMANKEITTQRSYSPVYKPRGLGDDDPLDVYEERVAEMGLEMDMAMEYLGDLQLFMKEGKEMEMLDKCNDTAAEAIDEHCETLKQIQAMMLAENDEADK